MEKTRKKILGFVCLAATVIITIIAANIPSVNTSAVGTTTKITMRVVGHLPNVSITESPTSVIETPVPIVITPNQAIKFICENVDPVNAGIVYRPFGETNPTVSQEIFSSHEDYQPCEHLLNLNLDDYGYGNFIVNVQGDGDSGFDEDSVTFDYSSLVIDANQEEPGEDPIVKLYYDDEVVDKIIVTVLDENGDPVPGLEEIEVPSGTHEIELPFADNDVPSGNYTVKATPYDEDGNIVPNKAEDDLTYIAPDLEVPNTGGPLGMLNLSRSDYIMTGIIVTIVSAAGALFFLSKKSNKKR